jgi:hypothetical protein
MSTEPNKTQKIGFIPGNELWNKIEDFRYSRRIPSTTETLRQLISDGLAFHEAKQTEAA